MHCISIKQETLSTKACASQCPPHHLQAHCLTENSCHASQDSYCVLWIPYISVKKRFIVSLIFDTIFRSISNRNPLHSAHRVDDSLVRPCFFLIQWETQAFLTARYSNPALKNEMVNFLLAPLYFPPSPLRFLSKCEPGCLWNSEFTPANT